MKGNRLLFGIAVVLLLVTSVLPGCNNEEPPVQADKLVIPSSMSPYEVFNETANAGPYVQTYAYFCGDWTARELYPYVIVQGATIEQFVEGFCAALPEFLYIKRNEERAGDRFDKIVSCIVILKYENTESAERSFINISETQKLQNLTYGGIALKNGTYTLNPESPERAYETHFYWDEFTVPCYLVQSGCFVIFFFGRQDVAKDILDRIIVTFGVKE